jgi:hypothetical protein
MLKRACISVSFHGLDLTLDFRAAQYLFIKLAETSSARRIRRSLSSSTASPR